ncbi:hypothetical protein [Bradyrhizobium cosmicum]|uniref:hypothetical protein n=1 Tax=Bradyrhizobium cosmicum TaxID=1404864 RepID=UPI0028E25AC3|nr:hypothetical protein [Bradyrhizobium cosmicum]
MTARAIKRVIARQLGALLQDKGLAKSALAQRMQTSRAQLGRLLNPNNESVTLAALTRARAGPGPSYEDGIGLGPQSLGVGRRFRSICLFQPFAESVYLSKNTANAESGELRNFLRFVPYARSTYRTINLVRPSYRRVSRVTGITPFLREAQVPRSANHRQAGVQTGGREKLIRIDKQKITVHKPELTDHKIVVLANEEYPEHYILREMVDGGRSKIVALDQS